MARDYTKIKAWQLADELALLVYKATKEFPKSEIWGLTSQMSCYISTSKYSRGFSQEEQE
jgi:four helix bundle protein